MAFHTPLTGFHALTALAGVVTFVSLATHHLSTTNSNSVSHLTLINTPLSKICIYRHVAMHFSNRLNMTNNTVCKEILLPVTDV